jgi:DHA3 family macrolide efflux protein-like MFS transporter
MLSPRAAPRVQTGFATFGLIWFGQVISLLGSGLTSFGLGIWVFQTTGQVTSYALIALAAVLPALLLSPISGALVDRWNTRIEMHLSDGASGLTTLMLAALFYTGRLELWHVCAGVAANSCFASFQQPAYFALMSKLVPSEQLGRAAGMVQLGLAASDVFAPLLAGLWIVQIKLAGMLLVDFSTFLFAAIILALVRIAHDANALPPLKSTGWSIPSLLDETRSGWAYVAARPGLLGLLAYLGVAGFASGMINSILVPMLLTLTTPAQLGLIISIAGGGMFAGGVAISAWGGPKRRMRGVLLAELVKGLGIVLIGLRPETRLVALGAVVAHFSIPFSAASNQAIWQAKIPQEMQGRVFAVRQWVTRSMMPLAYLLAGPLADRVFEPLMRTPHGLSGLLGPVVGFGPGRGMGLLFSLMGLLVIIAAAIGMLMPAMRNVEDV